MSIIFVTNAEDTEDTDNCKVLSAVLNGENLKNIKSFNEALAQTFDTILPKVPTTGDYKVKMRFSVEINPL